MDQAAFNELCSQLDKICENIVYYKRPEYTERSGDVLLNFKKTAEECGLTPYQVLYVFMRKHWASIAQFCKDPNYKQSEDISMRIADSINYHKLLYGLIIELTQPSRPKSQ